VIADDQRNFAMELAGLLAVQDVGQTDAVLNLGCSGS
jgi:hypothetical protein